MGGDIGPSETVPAAVQALSLFSQLKLILVGDPHQDASSLLQPGFEHWLLYIIPRWFGQRSQRLAGLRSTR
ncbi:hypothetical protein ACLK2C_05780 [Escherichia coli]